jgi:hypothetical protein
MPHKLPRTLQAVPNTLHARLEIADAMRKLSAADQEVWVQQRREELGALRRDMEKLREDLRKLSRAFPTLLLTELRKAGFNPDEPRVPAGDSKAVAAIVLSRPKLSTRVSIGFAVAVLVGCVVETAVKWAVGRVLSHFQ